MLTGYFTLFVSISIATVAAYYSIVGLIAIFSGALIPIAVMGSVLEVGKLVTTSWLYNNWKKVNILLKTYLTFAVVILMIITSLGIFGFLSKAHLETSITDGGNNELIIQNLERQISAQRRIISDGEVILAQLDQTVSTLIEYDRIRGPEGALAVREGQREQREAINLSIQSAVEQLDAISEKLLPLQQKRLEIEVEVGPLKYIAELIYGDQAKDNFDKAVRWVIILLVVVFDPLAVMLLIAANMTINENKPKRIEPSTDPEPEPEPQSTPNPQQRKPLSKIAKESSYMDRHKRPEKWSVPDCKLVVDKDNVSKL